MVKYLIAERNGRDKPRYGVGVFSHDPKKNRQEAEFLTYVGGKTYATKKNALSSFNKKYPNEKVSYLKW